ARAVAPAGQIAGDRRAAGELSGGGAGARRAGGGGGGGGAHHRIGVAPSGGRGGAGLPCVPGRGVLGGGGGVRRGGGGGGGGPAVGADEMSDLMADFFVSMVGPDPAEAWARRRGTRAEGAAGKNAARVLRRLGVPLLADLSGQDLHGQDFSGADWGRANLS